MLRRPGLKKDRSFLQVSAFLTFLPLQFWHHVGHRQERVAGLRNWPNFQQSFALAGTVMKVSGPLVVAENMSGTKMYEARMTIRPLATARPFSRGCFSAGGPSGQGPPGG